MKINVKMSIETPKVPNFFRDGDGNTVPICAVTDDGLNQIAEEWRLNLLARAAVLHRQHYGKDRNAIGDGGEMKA